MVVWSITPLLPIEGHADSFADVMNIQRPRGREADAAEAAEAAAELCPGSMPQECLASLDARHIGFV
jgi:hypothetical protein